MNVIKELKTAVRELRIAGVSFSGLDKHSAQRVADSINAMLEANQDALDIDDGTPLWDSVGPVINDDGLSDGLSSIWKDCMKKSGILSALIMLQLYSNILKERPGDTFWDPETSLYWRKMFRIIIGGINWRKLFTVEVELDPKTQRHLMEIRQMLSRLRTGCRHSRMEK